MMLSEQIALEGQPIAGFRLVGTGQAPSVSAQLPYKAGDIWELNFYAKQPVSDQQLSSLAEKMSSDVDIISFASVTERHFRAIVKWLEAGHLSDSSELEWAGVQYTMTARPYTAPDERKKLSTGAIISIGFASLAAIAGVSYAIWGGA